MKNWTRKDYDNAVGAVIRWFWEPLSENCKRELKEHMRRMEVGYEIDKFISAVFGVKMCAILAPEIGISESDLKNLDEIVNFIKKYEEQLMSFDPEDSVVAVGEAKDFDIESDYEKLLSDIDIICDVANSMNDFDDYDGFMELLECYLETDNAYRKLKTNIIRESKVTITIDEDWD